MTFVLAGTGYGQVFSIPLQVPKPKQKITKYGIMKKQKINSIALPLLTQQENIQSFFYSSQKHVFEGFLHDQYQNTVYTNSNPNSKIIGVHNFHQDSIIVAFNNGSLAQINKQLAQQNTILPTKKEANIKKEGLKQAAQQNTIYYNFHEILPAKLEPSIKKEYRKIISDNKKSYCLIGKQVLPFLFDSNKSLISWNGKNVPNDQLDLRVPIDDVDATFFKNGSSLACAHASNKIRIYDVRSNKQKPSADYHLKLDKIYTTSYLTKILNNSSNQHLFYVSNDVGAVYECDIRHAMRVTGKFKNINSTVTDMKMFQQKLFIASSDCYVRSYNTETHEMLDKHYMNKQLFSLHLFTNNKKNLNEYDEQALSEAEQQQINPKQESKKMKKLRKRNKINLKYLKPINWDDVPIDQQLLKQAEQQYQQINPKDADSYLDQQNQENKVKNQHQSDSDLD